MKKKKQGGASLRDKKVGKKEGKKKEKKKEPDDGSFDPKEKMFVFFFSQSFCCQLEKAHKDYFKGPEEDVGLFIMRYRSDLFNKENYICIYICICILKLLIKTN
jgi:hypothetical protein